MQYGNGGIIFHGLPNPVPGPPFSPTSADNGLSVDPVTKHIVLGNDLGGPANAALLSNREIPMAGFAYWMTSGGNRQLQIEPATGLYILGDPDAALSGMQFRIDADPLFNRALISDNLQNFAAFDGVNSQINFNINDSIKALGLQMDAVNALMQLGDTGGSNNGQMLLIDDGNQACVLGDVNGVAGQSLLFLDTLDFEVDCGTRNRLFTFGISQDTTRISTGENVARARIELRGPTHGTDPLTMQLLAANGIFTNADGFLIHSQVAYTNGAAASVGTLNNAPGAGNPSKWIPVDDAGTTRFIPAW